MQTHEALLRADVDARHERLRAAAHPFSSIDRPVRRRSPVWPHLRVRSRPTSSRTNQPFILPNRSATVRRTRSVATG
jgi:hypothetical protein